VAEGDLAFGKSSAPSSVAEGEAALGKCGARGGNPVALLNKSGDSRGQSLRTAGDSPFGNPFGAICHWAVNRIGFL
jgi:hypothetical protein